LFLKKAKDTGGKNMEGKEIEKSEDVKEFAGEICLF